MTNYFQEKYLNLLDLLKKLEKDYPYSFEKFANCVHEEVEYRDKYIQLICWSRENYARVCEEYDSIP